VKFGFQHCVGRWPYDIATQQNTPYIFTLWKTSKQHMDKKHNCKHQHSTTGTVTNVNLAFLNSFNGRYCLPFLLLKLHITKFSSSYNYKAAVTSSEAFKEGVLVTPSKEPFWIQSGFSSVESKSFLLYLHKGAFSNSIRVLPSTDYTFPVVLSSSPFKFNLNH